MYHWGLLSLRVLCPREWSSQNLQAIAMSTKLGNITLPDNPTPEQLERAEPLLVKMILEDSERAYSDGIQPLTRVESNPKAGEFVRTAPGEYEGIFVDIDGEPSFKFQIVDGASVYSPIGVAE